MKNRGLFIFTKAIIFSFLLSSYARAQAKIIRYDTLYSVILKEKRPLQIIFPNTYKVGLADKYDVLYVLDGEWNTSLTEHLYGFLQYAKFIPANIIIVSIPNVYQNNINLRDRDFTPTHVDYSSLSGGAANFLSFLKDELIPYVNKMYPAKSENNTLYGTSLGGLFAVYAFLYEPKLFKSYLTVEASLWWDNGWLNKIARQKLTSMTGLHNTLWIAARDGMAYHEMGISGFDSVLAHQVPEGLDWKVEAYPNETHFSTIWKGIYDGLKFSYKGLIPEGDFLLRPLNGRLVKAKPFKLKCYNLSSESYIVYTTDGSEPTVTSSKLKYENIFNFSEPATLTIKSLSTRKENAKITRCDFKVEDLLTAIQKPKNVKQGGLLYKYYRGDWYKLPDFDKIKSDQKGFTENDFDVNKFDMQNGFACLLEGFLEIPEEGYYIFEMGDDSNSKVCVGNQLVIGDHNIAGRGQSFIIYLQKGFYPYKVAYLHKKGESRLYPVRWKTEDEENFTTIPTKFLYGQF